MSNMTGVTAYSPYYPDAHSQRMFDKIKIFNSQKQATRFGHSNTRAGTKTVKKKNRKVSTLRTRVLAISPAKHFIQNTGPTMNQSELYVANVTAGPVQGTANNQRIGDAIQLEALKISGSWYSGVASTAYSFRVLVGYSGEEYNGTTLATGKLTPAEIFFTGATSQVNSIVNPKAFTVLYDEKFDINSQIDAAQTVHTFDQTVMLKRKFVYQGTGGSVYGKDKNLYIICVGFGAGITVGNPIGQILMDYDLIFKD